jgi:hypothetical protein
VHEAENTALAPGEDNVMIMVLLGKTAEPPHRLAPPTLRRPKTRGIRHEYKRMGVVVHITFITGVRKIYTG